MSQQGLQQASLRAVTGKEYSWNGDWYARAELSGLVPGGSFATDYNGRLLAWLNLKLTALTLPTHDNLPGAMAAIAAANGATNFSSMGSFNAN